MKYDTAEVCLYMHLLLQLRVADGRLGRMGLGGEKNREEGCGLCFAKLAAGRKEL